MFWPSFLFLIFSPHIFNIVGRLKDLVSPSAYGRQKFLEIFLSRKPFLSPLKQLIGTEVSLADPEMPWLSNSLKTDLFQREFHSCFHNLISRLMLQIEKKDLKLVFSLLHKHLQKSNKIPLTSVGEELN